MIKKVASHIESHDSTLEIMNHVKIMATESASCERSRHPQWFKMCSFLWVATKARAKDLSGLNLYVNDFQLYGQGVMGS